MDVENLVKAIRKVANNYACNGTHDSDLISGAFERLADEIESSENLIWPSGCIHPNSCASHNACMYTNCAWSGKPLKFRAGLRKALAEKQEQK